MLSLISHFGRDVVGGWRDGLGDPVVAPRRVIALPTDAEQRQCLLEISRSQTEPASRVERARIILAYLEVPSVYAVGRSSKVPRMRWNILRCSNPPSERARRAKRLISSGGDGSPFMTSLLGRVARRVASLASSDPPAIAEQRVSLGLKDATHDPAAIEGC